MRHASGRARLASLFFALIAAAVLAPATWAASHRHVCGPASAHFVRCHAEVVTNGKGEPLVTPAPSGYGAPDVQSAYALAAAAASAGGSQTIGIVDAYDAPSAEADLGVYRSQYGLSACTTANGCFRKVGQAGTAKLPKRNSGWAQEISLDLDMASAICPNCKILLVEGNSASITDLGAAVNTAIRLGATVVSNSYGAPEWSSEASSTYASPYNHPGVPITASSGDNGYGVEFPAALSTVTAVGGTHLVKASNTRGWTETAWSGAGSGCSQYVSKPSWQTDSGCSRRTVADVSAIADPNTGVAVYDSFAYQGQSGWMVFGGTSVAAPVIAGVYALAGNGAGPSFSYSHTASLFDVTSGSNGSCGGSYLCTAVAGFDGPTGLGTPNGLGGF
jgi:subtilase family serine protease